MELNKKNDLILVMHNPIIYKNLSLCNIFQFNLHFLMFPHQLVRSLYIYSQSDTFPMKYFFTHPEHIKAITNILFC